MLLSQEKSIQKQEDECVFDITNSSNSKKHRDEDNLQSIKDSKAGAKIEN